LDKIKSILLILVITVVLIMGILFLTEYINSQSFDQQFFTVLGSVSTSIAAIGGLLLLLVTFLYLLETRKMATEARRQRELLEEPAVSLKIVPDKKDPNFLFVIMKNTGGGPAYDVSVVFTPDLKYSDSSLNQLKMFNNMPLLDKNEEIKFFFDSAVNLFDSENSKETTVKITYYKTPKANVWAKQYTREFAVDFEERKGQLYLSRRDIHDLVNEVEELKQVLLIGAVERKGDLQ